MKGSRGIRGAQLDHVAIAAPRLADAVGFLVGELGGRPGKGGPGAGYRWADWEYAGGGRVEVLEPAGTTDGFLHRFLARQGPGLHHVTFKVPELAAAAESARDFGYEVVGYNDSVPAWKEAFLHPGQALGIVVQLAESNPELEGDDWHGLFSFPPAPEPRGRSVQVVGVRMTARTAERARHQWEALLGGSCEERAELLVFRWPPSPMRVAVTVDPDAEEGGTGIEIASDRPIALPEAPHLGLGVFFVPVEGSG